MIESPIRPAVRDSSGKEQPPGERRIVVRPGVSYELHEVPALLLEFEDERTRARRREGMLLSIIVHLVAMLAILLLPKYLPKNQAIALFSPAELLHQRELTFLELPPDAQQPPVKPPDTKIISDKNRIATSRAPVPDRKTLDELRDSARPGAPGNPLPPAPTPSPQQMASVAAGDRENSGPPPDRGDGSPPDNQLARLQAPPLATRGGFQVPLSAGAAIDQAARAAARTGGTAGVSGGDFGLGPGASQGRVRSNIDVLSDTMGVDFGPYLSRVLHQVRINWYNLIPEVARAPLMKSGKVSIEFAILKDGSVAGMRLTGPSGDVALDRAAWGGITASNPFPPLPQEFRGSYLALRFHFYYNPGRNEMR